MKKILITIALFTIIYVFINNNDYYVIPKEAIRFRIVANSNSFHDQYIKHRVKETLEIKDGNHAFSPEIIMKMQ